MKNKVEENARVFEGLVAELIPDKLRIDGLMGMLNSQVGTSFYMAPASAREEYHYSHPGGLTAHSIETCKNALKISNALEADADLVGSMVFVSLFHDLGKAGDGEEDYYIEQTSDWHRKRGINYEINPKCVAMSVPDRSIYILQKHGIKLTQDEYLAIKLAEADDKEDLYKYRQPDLALLLNWANRWSIQMYKNSL